MAVAGDAGVMRRLCGVGPVTGWVSGWVVLPGTRMNPEPVQHRLHRDRWQATMCDRVVGSRPVSTGLLQGYLLCVRCEAKFRAQRLREQAKTRGV